MTKADMMSPSSTFSLASGRTSILEASEQDPFDAVAHTVGSPPPAAVLSGSIPLSSPTSDEMASSRGFDDPASHLRRPSVPCMMQGAIPLPTPPFTQPARSHGLRLPSFNELGIGFPHPQDLNPARSGDSFGASFGGAQRLAPEMSQNAAILTPPEDSFQFKIQSLSGSPSSAPMSPKATTSYSSPRVPLARGGDATSSDRSEEHQLQFVSGDLDETSAQQTRQERIGSLVMEKPRSQSISIEGLDQRFDWLAPGIMAVASCISSTQAYTGSLKVLSHALPAPTMPGHVYAHIVDTVRAQCAPGQMQWINLMHAVPGRLNLADLPSSPPATPGPPIGGQDYFTTKVFNSAVTAISDGEDDGVITPRAASDRLLCAPGSVELSIVERYIPPCTSSEISNMFSLEKQSILVDRLVELTPSGGCLAFIYPTQAGAQTFQDKYLAPVLDPILRSMISLHNLSTDFGQAVSESSTVRSMLPYPDFQAKLQDLCDRLNRDNARVRARLHGVPGKFSLVYSEEVQVELSSKIWSNWWIRQEKVRLQKAISHYFVRGRRLPEDGKYQQAVLVEQLLNGLVREASNTKPECGVALGVFVIKRGN